jgi:hypothetical protein
MHPALSRPRATILFAAIITTAAAGYSVHATADTTTTTTTSFSSTCFAQLLSLQLGGNDVPLDSGRTCEHPGDSFFPTDTIAGPAKFPFVVNVLYENTSRSADQSSARARAGVAQVFLPLSAFGGPDVTVDVLTSRASCSNGGASGSSHVVGINVGGKGVELPDAVTGSPIALGPLGSIAFNTTNASSHSSDTGASSNPRVETTTNNLTQTALHVVLFPGQAPGGADGVDLTIAKAQVSCTTTKTTTTTITPPPPPPAGVDWMTGGGQVGSGSSTATHSLVLPCTLAQSHPGPHLGVVYKSNGNHHFTLTSLSSVSCSLDPKAGSPAPPKADFNTLTGQGNGTCDGLPAHVSFTFTDSGEPGTSDTASITISSSSSGGCSLSVSGPIANGDQQAHTGHNPPA